MEVDVPAVDDASVWGLVALKKGEKRAQQKVLNNLHKTSKTIDTPDDISDARTSRRLAFRAVKRQLTLWKGPVHRNRLADQLIFPLNDKSIVVSDSANADQKTKDLHVAEMKKNDKTLQGKLYNALYHDQSLPRKKSDTPDSKIRTHLLEVIASRQKERYLLARAAAKNKLQNKIKSKNFHKHLKKRTMKQLEASMDRMRESNPKAFAERLYRAELNRAKERASLRHRGGSKFARMQKLRAKYDGEARNAVAEMHERSKELTKHTGVSDQSESEDSDIDVTSESECDSDEEEFSNQESDEDSRTENTIDSLMWWKNSDQDKSVSQSKTKADPKPVVLSTLAADSILERSSGVNSQNFLSIENDTLDANADAFYNTIQETCALDPTVGQNFAEEKSQVIDEETPKDVDTFLPGWNSWTGPGLEAQDEERRKRRRIPAPKTKREDDDKPHVLMRRRRLNTEFRQHLVKSIPFPYNTPEQFESFIAQPVCREWVTESTHRELTRPKVTVQCGRIIRPISKSTALLRDKDVERLNKQSKNV